MTWIKTIPFDEDENAAAGAWRRSSKLYPIEYAAADAPAPRRSRGHRRVALADSRRAATTRSPRSGR